MYTYVDRSDIPVFVVNVMLYVFSWFVMKYMARLVNWAITAKESNI